MARISVVLPSGVATNAGLLLPALLLIGNLNFCGGKLSRSKYFSRDDDTTLPETTIPQGTLRGVNMVTHYNRTIHGFMGVPYAQPPVGDLRFKAPVAANSWTGTLIANNDSEPCPQFDDRGDFIGSEDCLYLNLFTPQLPTSNDSTLLPVMVFVVGGGFKTEIISPVRYGPYFLLDKDVLLVAPNFRVGVLGYLTTGDEVSPGNYGLKDIICALEWVQKNIRHFGGDPNQVTLFGGSSGSMSVHLLTLSNLTKGLFHKYITQSGSALAPDFDRPREVSVTRTTRLGEYFGCPTSTSAVLVNCLRSFSAAQLLNTNSIFYEWRTYPNSIWFPTPEPDTEGAVFTDFPKNIFAAGNIRDLPWIALLSQEEGFPQTSRYYEDPDSFEDFLENIDLILPYLLAYGGVVDDEAAYTAALKSFYLNDLTADRSILLANLTQMVGDCLFIYPLYKAVKQQLVLAKSHQYFASFQYRGTFSFSYFFTGSTRYRNAVHADEMIYLFGHQEDRLGPVGDEFSAADWAMVDNMVQLWTSFATYGIPNIEDWTGAGVWEPFSSRNNYLQIGNHSDTALEMKYDLNLERLQFWYELTEASSSSGELRNPLQVVSIVLCLCLLSYNE